MEPARQGHLSQDRIRQTSLGHSQEGLQALSGDAATKAAGEVVAGEHGDPRMGCGSGGRIREPPKEKETRGWGGPGQEEGQDPASECESSEERRNGQTNERKNERMNE